MFFRRAKQEPPESDRDFVHERDRMVDSQLAARNITDSRVLAAMRTVPRHRFVSEALRESAYEDRPLEIGAGQTISQPYMVALMTQLLHVQAEDSVLEVGTGSGYQTAILASIARTVVTIERIDSIASAATARLKELEYLNVDVHIADGTLGWHANAPYDAIMVTAGSPSVPPALKAQLAEGGRLICPVGPREMQRLIRVVRDAHGFREEEGIGCVFVPLIGDDGWSV